MLEINRMIQCHVFALIMHVMIRRTTSKDDSLENADNLTDSKVQECSEGVGWKVTDPGGENEDVWKVSRKNLDIVLQLDKLLTKYTLT